MRRHHPFHNLCVCSQHIQTARVIDPLSGETKMEFRGHDNAVEVVVFAPATAYGAIRELAGIPVRRRIVRFCQRSRSPLI